METDHQFLLALRQLAVRVRGVDPKLHSLAFFRTPTDAEMVRLRRSMIGLLEEADSSARALIDDLLPRLDGTPLEDLAAIIGSEIGKEIHKLDGRDIDNSSTWEVGIVSVEILAKVLKAAAALENAYCQELSLESEISHVADVETAIQIRQAYFKFWSSIETTQPECDGELESRLRSAATVIARLRGKEIFLDLRPLDRRLLLRLHRRIGDWLATDGIYEEGLSVWHDLIAFADLLQMINHRAELVEHDSSLLPEVLSQLADLEPGSAPLTEDAELLQRLRRMAGRNPKLDALLERPEAAAAKEIFEVLGQMEIEMLGQMGLPGSL